jgi:amino acid transporter
MALATRGFPSEVTISNERSCSKVIQWHPKNRFHANINQVTGMDLFRCKPIEKAVEQNGATHSFKRVLNGFHLILLGIGSIIGTGIFVLTGTAAAGHAGPALAISFIISGLGCLCAGLCYAEFASTIPLSGSAYSYAYATIGEFLAWIIGWDLILEYLVGAATVASGWSGYAVKLVGEFGVRIQLSHATLSFAGERLTATGAYLNLPAVFVIVLITCILMVGIRESALVGVPGINRHCAVQRVERCGTRCFGRRAVPTNVSMVSTFGHMGSARGMAGRRDGYLFRLQL